ncbi:hypothetical protein Tco_1130704 [Tanacetum coccineum]
MFSSYNNFNQNGQVHHPQAQTSYHTQAPSPRQTTSARSYVATRNKGKEIVKSPSPPTESDIEEDSDEEQAQRDKDIQNEMASISRTFKNIYKPTNNNLITSSNTRHRNEVILTIDDDTGPTYDTEPLEKEHSNDDYNVFTNEREHSEQPEYINDKYVVKKADSNITPNSSDMSNNE